MERLRLGIVGTGSVVREIYRHLYFHSDFRDLIEVVAAADPNPENLRGFAAEAGLPAESCFADHASMFDRAELDVVQVNTPDHLHDAPAIAALERGLDVLVPKPLAHTVEAAHRMIDTAQRHERLLVVDFHKRSDPRVIDAAARFQAGAYGALQVAVLSMIDKLLVADPNHEPRFFATPDYAEKNTPISFLTVHMADVLLQVVAAQPVRVQARGWSQKLPTLQPTPVHGYDLCDTQIHLENGAVAHLITGWHLPNTAHSITTGDGRLICTDGQLDIPFDTGGNRELTHQGIAWRNALFLTHHADGRVSGYGVEHPGRLYQALAAHRAGAMSEADRQQMLDPIETGFWTTAILEAAEQSLDRGKRHAGVVEGEPVDLPAMLRDRLGDVAETYLSSGANRGPDGQDAR